MSKKLERCVKKLKAEGKEESNAYAICKAAMTDQAVFHTGFTDSLVYDSATKSVVSARDGVQEYLGAELGMTPAEKKFRIYRSRDALVSMVDTMPGLPITHGHIALTDEIVTDIIKGKIIDAVLVDAIDETTDTTTKIKHKISLNEIPANKELSLGYFADLIPCDLYDFEQVDIVPHHLAIVEKGRCGEICKFTDEKGVKSMKKKYDVAKAFLDAEGQVNIQQVLELVADLPQVIKTLDITELAKLIPILQEAVASAKAGVSEEGGEPAPAEGEPAPAPAAEEKPTEDVEEKDKPEDEEDDKKKMTDSSEFKDAVAKAAKDLTREYAIVLAKARDYLPKDFKFADKSSVEIMRAALETQHTEKFSDSELTTAFKLLKRSIDYSKFGDSKPGSLMDLKDKEI